MSRSHRTTTGFFVGVMAIVIGSVLWASHPTSGSSVVLSEPAPDQAAVADGAATTGRWQGSLLVLTNHRAIIAYSSAGNKRTVYEAAADSSVGAVSPLTDGSVAMLVNGPNQRARIDRVTVADGRVTEAVYPVTPWLAPRPGSSTRAEVRFSNAERDFGSTVELVTGASRSPLIHRSKSISALAWRRDGEVLAIGAQDELTLVQVSAGDSRTVNLPGPVRSLSWYGGSVLLLTTAGPLELAADAPTPQRLTLSGTISSDLVGIGPQQYAWLAGEGQSANLVLQTLGEPLQPTEIQANAIIGILP